MNSKRESAGSFYDVEPKAGQKYAQSVSDYRPISILSNDSHDPPNGGRSEPLKRKDDEKSNGDVLPEPFNIWADFNNVGPRYSTTIQPPQPNPSRVTLIPSTSGAKTEVRMSQELPKADDSLFVTVPALGAEWQRSELKGMSKSGRSKKKRDERLAFLKAWNRGEVGLCGTRWLTRTVFVFLVFGMCAVIAIILAITIPRVPAIQFSSSGPLSAATGSFNESIPAEFSRFPANFSFAANADVQVDTTSNIIPLTFKSIAAQLWYPTTNMLIAEGSLGKQTLPAKAFPIIHIPLNFSYIAPNDTDSTWVAWYNSCKNGALYTNGVRPGLNFELLLQMDIEGLPSTYSASAQAANAACPIQLPINSV